jgi:hypothetical protein
MAIARPKNNPGTRIAHVDRIPFNPQARVDDITECMGDILAHEDVIKVKIEGNHYVIQVRARATSAQILRHVNALKRKYHV